jgi:hypothetical protein
MQIPFTPYALTWSSLVEKLQGAKEQIVLVLPAIHEEWVQAIYDYTPDRDIPVKICIENSDTIIRKGYGNVEALKKLQEKGADIRQVNKLRLGFICLDDFAGFLFLESRIISGDPEGLNFVACTIDEAEGIMNYFFPEEQPDEPSPNEENPSEPGSNQEVPERPKPFDEGQFSKVVDSLKKNPPVQPELERKINTYRTLFQYAELHYEGARFAAQTISIPSDALPFKDADLKNQLITRLKLFEKDAVDSWEQTTNLSNEINEIRKKFLTPCKLRKGKCILKKSEKEAFQNAIAAIREKQKGQLKELLNKMQAELNLASDRFRVELEKFFEVNQPDSAEGLDPEVAAPVIKREIEKVISKIKIPLASTLIGKVNLEAQYAELTYEDLYDQKFIKWFYEKDLIKKEESESLANFEPAFELKKEH